MKATVGGMNSADVTSMGPAIPQQKQVQGAPLQRNTQRKPTLLRYLVEWLSFKILTSALSTIILKPDMGMTFDEPLDTGLLVLQLHFLAAHAKPNCRR